MSSSADSSPPALDYATPSTDQAVLLCRTEIGATVVVRDPARRGRAVSDAMSAAAGMILAVFSMGGCVIFSSLGFGPSLALIVATLAPVALWAWVRCCPLAQPLVIELTANDLIFLNLDNNPAPAIPRGRIYAVECVACLKSLVVRAEGRHTFEHRFSLPVEKIEEIAAFLRSVLNLKPEGERLHE